MADRHQTPLHLRRVDASCNMQRFYALSIQPTLFGETSVMRNWGRIGTRGQCKVETFDDPLEAAHMLARLDRTKRRRGYRDIEAG
ncbi:WGR domain-containing protein [Mesorhizobium sp. CAU 1732]|uniref:WGR domain-containing protein n=1 Tax=Mesorhizobium sp. CAU 1732 TaxID=3140358 RepID=UPI003261AB09